MANVAFANLQSSVVKNSDFNSSDIREALRYLPESPETFSTFHRALTKKKIDPTELFVICALFAVEVDNIFIRYAALALRFGANPNTYVKAHFDFGTDVPIHLGKHIFDVIPRTAEESIEQDLSTFGDYDETTTNEAIEARLQEKQRAGLDIICMMAIKGLIPDAQITTAALLTQSQINATRFANEHPDFFGSVYGFMKTDDELGSAFADELKYFEQWKSSLQNAYGVVPARDERILKYALLLDIKEVLTLSDIYGSMDNLQLMFFFQDTESLNLILPRLKDLEIIGFPMYTNQDYQSSDSILSLSLTDESQRTDIQKQHGEMKKVELILLDWCITYYSLATWRQLLDLGVVPDYSMRSQLIRTAKKVCSQYPAQCQILNTMIVDCVKYGHGFDNAQLDELSFSPSTLQAVTKEYNVPAWQQQCMFRDGEVQSDLLKLAREVGIPINYNKSQICDNLETMKKSSPASLTQAIQKVNKDRIVTSTTSPADVLFGRKTLTSERNLPNSLNQDVINASSPTDLKPANVDAPLCSNVDTLGVNIEDIPDIDRISYSDGLQTWCFTSRDYQQLLETGINPWAIGSNGQRGSPIPQEVITEIERKYNLLLEKNLMVEPASISKGVMAMFDSNPRNTIQMYDNESNRKLQTFYDFVEEGGIPRETFISLSSEDIQTLADSVLNPATRVVVNASNQSLALRDFASAVLLDASNFGSGPQILTTLRSILVQ